MEYRLLQRKDSDSVCFIQKKVKLYRLHFWFSLINVKSFFIWYLFGVFFQFLFGLFLGWIWHLFSSDVSSFVMITSSGYFICSFIAPLFSVFRNSRQATQIIEWKNQKETSFRIRKIKLFKKFVTAYSNVIKRTEFELIVIEYGNVFQQEITNFWGKKRKVYYLGIKQLRREKLEKLQKLNFF